jgi:hypothetical protein
MHREDIMGNIVSRRGCSGFLGLALIGVAAAGCGEAPTQEAAEQDAAETATDAAALFRDPSTSGPRLDVYDFDGHAAISVSGPIGTEAQLAGLTVTDSLEDLYKAVHPDATTVPAELIALSDRLAPALAELRSMPRPADAKPATIEKSQSAFYASVCKIFPESTYKYVPLECQWSDGIDQLLSFASPNNILAGDRTYGWNNNPVQAKMYWGKNAAMVYQITLPQYWWTWMSVASGGPYYAKIYLSGGWTGELGLTRHGRRPL